MNILVAGATGFVGRHLVNSLEGRYEIFALTRRVPVDVHAKVHWIIQDLTRRIDYSQVPKRIDAVVHLAQSEYFRNFPEHSVDLFEVNTVSTLRLLEYARVAEAKSFVYASSGGVYGYSDDGFTEDAEIKPHGELGFYLGSKLCSEILCDCYTSFMNVIVLRFFFVYGPRQTKSMLIPRLVESVKEGKTIVLHGTNGIKINPTYVSDAAEALRRALQLKQSHKINVGGPQVLHLREIGHIIGKGLKKEPKFNIDYRVKPRHLIGDISKMSKLLTEPKVYFKDGIMRYLDNESC